MEEDTPLKAKVAQWQREGRVSPPPTLMDFAAALLRMKKGACVARVGWDGFDRFVFLLPGFSLELPALEGIFEAGTQITYQPHLGMRSPAGYVVPWSAPPPDLLASDWVIVVA